MVNWIIISITAYIILAVVSLVDKYLLTRAIPQPQVYAFYVGGLGIVALLLIPFVGFYIPGPTLIIFSLLTGVVYIYAQYWLYKTLKRFEASRVIPALGALTPLFTFSLIYLLSEGQASLSPSELFAFFLLITGGTLITVEKKKKITAASLKFSVLTALFFSLYFVSAKYVYIYQSFWNGFLWMRIGGFLLALVFLFTSPIVREKILEKQRYPGRKTGVLFLSNQAAGAGASTLQQWAIKSAPFYCVSIINAFEGTKYAFLFILTVVLSLKRPDIIKEKISRKIISQKLVAILLISLGLTILVI